MSLQRLVRTSRYTISVVHARSAPKTTGLASGSPPTKGAALYDDLPVPCSAAPSLAQLYDNARSAVVAITGEEPLVLEDELQAQLSLLGGDPE